MSTRSLIAVKNEDGTVSSIYCHFDGYPEYVGKILVENYTDPEKIKALLALGSLSSLAPRLAPNPDENHSFDNPVDEVCVAYHRDRGEDLRPAKLWKDEKQMVAKASDDYWAEFCYLWNNGVWSVDQTYHPEGFRPVSEVLKKDESTEGQEA